MYICIDRHTDTKRPFAMERTQRSKELIGDTATAKAVLSREVRNFTQVFLCVVRFGRYALNHIPSGKFSIINKKHNKDVKGTIAFPTFTTEP